MANPPFNVSGVRKEDLEGDWRFPYGVPKPDNANYLWIQMFDSALNDQAARASSWRTRRVMPGERAVDPTAADRYCRKSMPYTGRPNMPTRGRPSPAPPRPTVATSDGSPRLLVADCNVAHGDRHATRLRRPRHRVLVDQRPCGRAKGSRGGKPVAGQARRMRSGCAAGLAGAVDGPSTFAPWQFFNEGSGSTTRGKPGACRWKPRSGAHVSRRGFST